MLEKPPCPTHPPSIFAFDRTLTGTKTHHEALSRLDAVTQLTLEGVEQNTPPTSPQEGMVWALGASPTGQWVNHPAELAAFVNGGWLFITPAPGWQATDTSDGAVKVWSGSAWAMPTGAALKNIDGIGINASYDAFNRLVIASEASLFNHDGMGHQIKINKAASGDTASLLFQTGFSGRAEMGTTGADDFAIKVSSDGAVWNTGLSFDATSGQAQAPSGIEVIGLITGTAVTQTDVDSTAGRLIKVGDFGIGANAAPFINDLDATNIPFGNYQTKAGATLGTFPTGSRFGQVIIFGYDNTTFMQIFA